MNIGLFTDELSSFFSFCTCSVRSRLAYKSTCMKRGSQKYTDLGNTIVCAILKVAVTG